MHFSLSKELKLAKYTNRFLAVKIIETSWLIFCLLALQIEEDIFAFSSAVGILHNCARNPDIDKDKFRNVGAIKCLLPFLHSCIPCKFIFCMLGNFACFNVVC